MHAYMHTQVVGGRPWSTKRGERKGKRKRRGGEEEEKKEEEEEKKREKGEKKAGRWGGVKGGEGGTPSSPYKVPQGL